MVSKNVKVINAQGFHMRPASSFVSEMSKFKSSVTINFGANKINAKSIMNLIAACIKCGSEIEIGCDGEDDKEALSNAVSIVESGFGE